MLAAPAITEPPPIAIEQSLAALNDDLPLLATLAQLVLDQLDVDLPCMRVDASAKNSAALAASSHRLKGSLGAIVATPAYEACSALNRFARSGAVDLYTPGLNQLEHEIDRLRAFLPAWLAEDKLR